MRWSDVKSGLLDFWGEFRRVKSGMVGLVLLVLFVGVVLAEPYIIPYSEAGTRWRDITYWEDRPEGVPPAWLFRGLPPTQTISNYAISEEVIGDVLLYEMVFSYDHRYDGAPQDLIFECEAIRKEPLMLSLSLQRPDDRTVDLLRKEVPPGVSRIRIPISKDEDAKNAAYQFALEYDENVRSDTIKTCEVLFTEARPSTPALRGTYALTAAFILSQDDRIEDARIVLPGKVSGLLGTDGQKRDIWSGIVVGLKWALLIGLLTAAVSVAVGVVYGVMSAYLGGWKDALMQRVYEIFVSIPLLPILIVMSAVFRPSVWVMITMMCIFFWVGPVKTVRSMGLQIKEETYIEASRGIGASDARIIFKHMVPLLIPYAFASMALNVPMAIVYESSISLLGLGDATIVTWGQILHDGFTGGAVLRNLWWWILPPGLAIAIVSMSFAFIGFAMDAILNPKLRTR